MSTAAQQTRAPEASASTCVVGCKLPSGLVVELFDKGPDKYKERRSVWKHKINGSNSARIYGGYGMTDGVDADRMSEWLKRNAEHPAVKAGLIFIHSNADSAIAHAKEFSEVRTGLEAIDPIADAKIKGVELDKEARAAYEKQKQENPMRNRQIVE